MEFFETISPKDKGKYKDIAKMVKKQIGWI